MEDTDSFSGNSFDSNYDNGLDVDDALFDSVAFDCEGGENDECDDDAFLRSEAVSQEDYIDDERQNQIEDGYESEEEDIEDQQQETNLLSSHTRTQRRKSTAGNIRYVKRRRSEYTARRFKSVDMMTDRLMMHADEYNKSNNPTQTFRSKALRLACLAVALLAFAMAGFLIHDLVQHLRQPQEQFSGVEVEEQPTNENSEYVLDHLKHLYHETIEPIPVPFAAHHNLDFNGRQFVKHRANSDGSFAGAPAFDSYAKTLDPITELRFEPGESNTTKQVILTTTNPASKYNSYSRDAEEEVVEEDPGLILSIGLEANGELWLPYTTGERIAELEKHPIHAHERIQKTFYSPGDSFVLTITDDAIALFRNDFHELIGMWMNPSSTATTTNKNTLVSSQSSSSESLQARELYAQIWFKEEDSSMSATAWHDHKP